MKHLDTLLDELQHPVDIVQAWCDEDKDRAVVACLIDLMHEKSYRFFEVLSEAYPDTSAAGLVDEAASLIEEITEYHEPAIEYDKLYQPLEHIINDRIEVYNIFPTAGAQLF